MDIEIFSEEEYTEEDKTRKKKSDTPGKSFLNRSDPDSIFFLEKYPNEWTEEGKSRREKYFQNKIKNHHTHEDECYLKFCLEYDEKERKKSEHEHNASGDANLAFIDEPVFIAFFWDVGKGSSVHREKGKELMLQNSWIDDSEAGEIWVDEEKWERNDYREDASEQVFLPTGNHFFSLNAKWEIGWQDDPDISEHRYRNERNPEDRDSDDMEVDFLSEDPEQSYQEKELLLRVLITWEEDIPSDDESRQEEQIIGIVLRDRCDESSEILSSEDIDGDPSNRLFEEDHQYAESDE